MGYIDKPGKFNKNTWLIDPAYKNSEGNRASHGHAVYLIHTEEGTNCLINSGPQSGAQDVYKKLKRLNAWPLHKLILTHSHWDHTQGVIFYREKVKEENLAPIQIFASEKAIPYLKDQSYNVCFSDMPFYSEFLNIEGVTPLKEKEKIILDNTITLEIIETPGHMLDHISLYDEKNKTAFVGDAPGMHWFTDFYVCNSNSIYWQENDYLESIEKIKTLDLDFLCIAHFGVFTGDDILRFLDNSVSMYYKWMKLLNQNSNLLEDPKSLINLMWETIYKDFNKPIYRQTLEKSLESSLLNAINYYKGLKKIG